jgi:hypothetical protein
MKNPDIMEKYERFLDEIIISYYRTRKAGGSKLRV